MIHLLLYADCIPLISPAESAEPGVPAPLEQASRAGLEQAFALFNQMSNQLSESYSQVQNDRPSEGRQKPKKVDGGPRMLAKKILRNQSGL